MSLSVEIPKKPNRTNENRKITKSNDVFELEEVQEIKDAVQENLLFIGLDRRNNIRNISLLGIGTSSQINIDSKYIVRTALITASDRVILVHNHPSNELEPSNNDKHITNVTSKLLKAFNIELTDHIIVAENNYISMGAINAIDKDYKNDRTQIVDKILLMEENSKLKKDVKFLINKLKRYEEKIQEDEEEFE